MSKKESPPAAVVALFNSLADAEDTEIISLEGLQSLGEQIGLDAALDVRFLVLLWKLGATSKPGCITRQEFVAGMRTMRKESLEALRQAIPTLDPGFLERNEFRDFYKFVFQFNREGTHKFIGKSRYVFASTEPNSLLRYCHFFAHITSAHIAHRASHSHDRSTSPEKEVAVDLMKLVLDVNRAPHLEHFIKFLESRTKTNETINLDEWTTFLQFNYMVNVSLSDYPEDNAFPILFEEYVTWRQSGPGKCVS